MLCLHTKYYYLKVIINIIILSTLQLFYASAYIPCLSKKCSIISNSYCSKQRNKHIISIDAVCLLQLTLSKASPASLIAFIQPDCGFHQ